MRPAHHSRPDRRPRGPGSSRGATLLETVIAAVLLAVLLAMLGAAFSSIGGTVSRVCDDEATFLRAASALVRIQEELSSAVQAPPGVTIAPLYAVSESAITYRRPVGFLGRGDAGYEAAAAEGRVSTSGILYAPYAQTIAFDRVRGEVRLTATGTLPPGMPAETVLARDVAEFRLFDGESHASPPAAATAATWVVGCRIVVRRASAAVESGGAQVDSSVAGTALSVKVTILPETLLNRRGKPDVGMP